MRYIVSGIGIVYRESEKSIHRADFLAGTTQGGW